MLTESDNEEDGQDGGVMPTNRVGAAIMDHEFDNSVPGAGLGDNTAFEGSQLVGLEKNINLAPHGDKKTKAGLGA